MKVNQEIPETEQEEKTDHVRIRSARVHNLKNVNLDIPRNKLVVLTGPSGSGKSTLAFDTLFAEGQRQYIESLSVYARQFLHQIQRPDVEMVEGLQPTICIDQRPGTPNPRSTVATVTEIYDHLRLLMARLGQAFCYQCGSDIRQQTPEQIKDHLLQLPEGTKAMIMAPLVRGRRGAHKDVLQRIRKSGFIRARIDGVVHDLENVPELATRRVHHIDAVVDRVIIREGIRSRVGESIHLALQHGDGLVVVCYLPYDQQSPDQNHDLSSWRNELYSTEYACPTCNISYEELEPRTFSFNSPYGACPVCEGLGTLEEFDPDFFVPDLKRSLDDGAIVPWKNPRTARLRKNTEIVGSFLHSCGFDEATPFKQLSAKTLNEVFFGDERRFLGVVMMLEKEFSTTTSKKRIAQLQAFRGSVQCKTCRGTRLRPEALSVRLGGKTVDNITSLSVENAQKFFDNLSFPSTELSIADPIVREILKRLEFLRKVGLDYLALSRSANTLSGGESQRVRLATSIGSGLVGACYILDEPSIGLHPRDNQRLIDSLRKLQSQGNTVLVVEHDEAIMRNADHLIDVGPGAGANGGRVLAEGTLDQLINNSRSITGQFLSGRENIPVPKSRRRVAKSRSLMIDGVETNNLQQVRIRFPLGALVCITGVSGSGKSSLVNETIAPALLRRMGAAAPKPGFYTSLRGVNQIDKVIQIDQSSIGRTPRSNAATYTGVFDEIRKVFASTRDSKQRGFGTSRFSFNVKGGRCDACQGQGTQKIEMSFLPDISVLCDQCDGARFNRQTLQVKYRSQSIADVLDMSVTAAVKFFENFVAISRVLQSLESVGLGYLPLGQPSTTLSGGEAQRVKLATELARVDTGKTLYLLDEPTTGLHFVDIRRLLNVLAQLVDKGNSVLVIEHNLDVIKCADWVIDLGPEGGENGGQVVAEGTPEQIAASEMSHTGRHLRTILGL